MGGRDGEEGYYVAQDRMREALVSDCFLIQCLVRSDAISRLGF